MRRAEKSTPQKENLRERERARERDRRRGRREKVWEQTKTNIVFTSTNVALFSRRCLESITRCKEKSTEREREREAVVGV